MSRYTPEQLRRRETSRWTRVQAITAPIQFLTFVASLVLVARYLTSGQGYDLAHIASVVKVVLMIFITVTGMLWEHDVYGQYFLATEFFWEDVVNGISLVFHLVFLGAWAIGAPEQTQMVIMAIALATYVVNFAQFAWRGAQSARQRRAERMRTRA
jgi:3-vinyl bacteriochlorophyllide hydratase